MEKLSRHGCREEAWRSYLGTRHGCREEAGRSYLGTGVERRHGEVI